MNWEGSKFTELLTNGMMLANPLLVTRSPIPSELYEPSATDWPFTTILRARPTNPSAPVRSASIGLRRACVKGTVVEKDPLLTGTTVLLIVKVCPAAGLVTLPLTGTLLFVVNTPLAGA